MSTNLENERQELTKLESLFFRSAFKTLSPIDEAIKVYNDLSLLTIISEADNKKISRILRDLLFQRYQEKYFLKDLEDAVLAGERVLGSTDEFERDDISEIDLADLEALGILLYHRALRKAWLKDIKKSVQISRIMTNHTPPTDNHRAARLDRLASCLYAKFKYQGDCETLDACISISAGATVISNTRENNGIAYLHNLAVHLFTRFERFAKRGDLERAEKLTAKALSSVNEGHLFWPELLLNRSRVLFASFNRTHFWRYLDEATTLAKEAIEAKDVDPLKLIGRNQNLAVFCLHSFQVSKKITELRAAYQYAIAAVNAAKEVKLVQNVARGTILEYFKVAFTQSGRTSDLQNILDLLQEQIHDMSNGPLRQTKVEHYTKLLCLKYRYTKDHLDFIFLCYEALQKLRTEKANAVDSEEVSELERNIHALTYLFGELYRLFLVPEYIDVRDALTKALHAAFLVYVEQGVSSALITFLKKHDCFLIRLDTYRFHDFFSSEFYK